MLLSGHTQHKSRISVTQLSEGRERVGFGGDEKGRFYVFFIFKPFCLCCSEIIHNNKEQDIERRYSTTLCISIYISARFFYAFCQFLFVCFTVDGTTSYATKWNGAKRKILPLSPFAPFFFLRMIANFLWKWNDKVRLFHSTSSSSFLLLCVWIYLPLPREIPFARCFFFWLKIHSMKCARNDPQLEFNRKSNFPPFSQLVYSFFIHFASFAFFCWLLFSLLYSITTARETETVENVFRSAAFSLLTSETWETFCCVWRTLFSPQKGKKVWAFRYDCCDTKLGKREREPRERMLGESAAPQKALIRKLALFALNSSPALAQLKQKKCAARLKRFCIEWNLRGNEELCNKTSPWIDSAERGKRDEVEEFSPLNSKQNNQRKRRCVWGWIFAIIYPYSCRSCVLYSFARSLQPPPPPLFLPPPRLSLSSI